MELKTELVACQDRMNVTDSGNAGFYNDIDPESLSCHGRYLITL